ncbi:hypothetical protein AB1Y20_001789 [Prymnesium parvum]|uniref:Protein Mpv17 n=1 Tax=Prymnesium parvum TaxID=97485 RepID=A0AB34K8T7_PRYPA
MTAGGIGGTGDLLMQLHEAPRTEAVPFDMARCARLAAFRAVHAPVIDAAWRVFDARLSARGGLLATGVTGAAARALCDQCILAPPSIGAFFLTQGLFDGLSIDQSIRRMQSSFIAAYQVAFPFWLSTHMITFGLIRPNWRIAWASFVAVFWNAFMSQENQRAKQRELGNVHS